MMSSPPEMVPPRPRRRRDRSYKRAVWLAYDWAGRVSGGRIQRPFARDILEHQWPLDDEENREITPGPDSHLRMLGIWAFEAYTPSTIETALAQMRRRGWGRAYGKGTEADLVSWLRLRRRKGGAGYHGVELTRARDRTFHTTGHDADLPDFALSAKAQLLAITPSISGLLVFFQTRPEEIAAIEAVLRTDVRSTAESRGRGVSVITPEVARQRAVEALRLRWRGDIAAFFRRHAPGVFSEGPDIDFPTCELLVSEAFPLFAPAVEGQRHDPIAMAIDGAYASYLFDAEKEDGVSLALSPCRSESLRSHAILASTREAFEGTVHSLNRPAGEATSPSGASRKLRPQGVLHLRLSAISGNDVAI